MKPWLQPVQIEEKEEAKQMYGLMRQISREIRVKPPPPPPSEEEPTLRRQKSIFGRFLTGPMFLNS